MLLNLIREVFEYILNIIKSRLFVLVLIVGSLFSVLLFRVFYLQIVKQQYYLDNYIQIAEKDVYTAGTRGNIYDRNGVLLAYNKLAYAVEIEDDIDSSDDKNKELNDVIAKTVRIILSNNDTIINDFKININANGEYEFLVSSDTDRLGFLRDIYGKKSIDELDDNEKNSTASDVMKFLCGKKKFVISDEYTDIEKLYIAMIRYKLSLNSYQKYISTKISSNVSENTVAAIYESASELKGVSVTDETIRVYNDSEYYSHILGYTGTVSEDQLASLNSGGGNYDISDVVGKSGIESVMEKDLQGKKGKQTILTSSTGKTLEVVKETKAKAGDDVYLSIDARMQKAGYTILKQKLAGILYSKIVNYDVKPAENMKTIPIPVKDVYFQMINNNVLDLNAFGLESATENEKAIYDTFIPKQKQVIEEISRQLHSSNPDKYSSLPEEYQDYYDYIYTDLTNKAGVINKKSINYDDSTYISWTDGNISFREFLMYAISKNWIDTSKIVDSDKTKYSDSDEIYNALVQYLNQRLYSDTGFSKKIYYYLIYGGSLSGNRICMALFDQGVLAYDEAAYGSLSSGGSSYDFIKEQIRLMNITPAQVALDPCSASLVVTSSNTGEVLAMITYPSYDNNRLSGTIDSVYWNKLNSDLSLPLYNRATQTRTAPGSTFKMLTAITGMEEGIIYPGRIIVDQGEFKKITPSAKCWKFPGNHGGINVSQALAFSCNYFFYETGYELSMDSRGSFDNDLGISKLKSYASKLGLTEKSGVEIEENDPIFTTQDSVRSAIGQGSNSFANIQLARYVTAVANGGNDYKLTLLDRVTDNQGNIIKKYSPHLENTSDFSQSTWNAVHQGMRMVVTEGTAKTTFKNFQIPVAGKSGTAQENKLRSNHAVFVAYAPYDNPEIALSVVIPNGESSGYNAEVIRDMIKYYYGLTTDEELYGGVAAVPTSGVTND